MTALTVVKDRSTELALSEEELISVLSTSLYPGASPESVRLVLGYCKAAGLDPMQKPAHIVPMRIKTGAKNQWGDDVFAMRDTIMPGIGLYRIQAARTGQYAGQDEPKFGPDETLTYQKKVTEWVEVQGQEKKRPKHTYVEAKLSFPLWCSITVYRFVSGHRMAFTATEFWLENYATAGRDTTAPNEMWARRTRGQLAKCAEAQALRKAFPEIGSAPTAEEMEGKIDYTETATTEVGQPNLTPQRKSAAQDAEDATIKQSMVAAAPPMQQSAVTAPGAVGTGSVGGMGAQVSAPGTAGSASVTSGGAATPTGSTISAGQVKHLEGKLKGAGLEGEAVNGLLSRLGIAALGTTMTQSQFDLVKAELAKA